MFFSGKVLYNEQDRRKERRMERIFDITMHVPLGSRSGTLCFTAEQNRIHGILEILGGKNSFTGTLAADGSTEFGGQITSLFHSFSYLARGTISEGKLELKISGGRYMFNVTGTEKGGSI